MPLILALPAPSEAQCPSIFDALQKNEWILPIYSGNKVIVKIYVTEIGNGPEVLVVHGGFGDDFSYLVDALKPLFDKYRFVFYDQRGSLRSPVKNNNYKKYVTFQDHVNDIEALRKALQLKKLVIIAHSMGTLIAQAYVAQYPMHVRGMVLLGSLPPELEGSQTLDSFTKQASIRANKMWHRQSVTDAIKAAGLWGNNLTPQQKFTHSKIIEAGANIVHIDRWRVFWPNSSYNELAADASYKSTPQTYDYRAGIKACKCYVSIIDGDHDYVDPGGALWKKYGSGLGNVDVTNLLNAGHAAWIDDPLTFRDDVDNSIEQAFK